MFLSINSTFYEVTQFSRSTDEKGGEKRRTLSGQLRGDSLWKARNWRATVLCETDSEAQALWSLSNTIVTVGGVAFGTNVQAVIEVTGDDYQHSDAGEHFRMIELDIKESL